jgi:hypothetical protein
MKHNIALKISIAFNAILLLAIVFLLIHIGKSDNSNYQKEDTPDSNNTAEYIESENDLMQYCKNTTGIYLYKDFDPESHSASGTRYSLRLIDDCARLEVQKPSWPIFTCDFSVDKFYELRDILCSTELEEYAPEADSNGKLIYETLDFAVFISNGHPYNDSTTKYLKAPTNLEKIKEYFEDLYKAAKE